MKSSVEPLEGNKVKLYVEVDEAEFDRDIDRAFKVIAREINLPGFRAGKAPRKVLEARVGIGPAREQALRDAVPSYLGKAIREHDVDLIATPEVEITGGEEDGIVEFEAECEVRPEVSIAGYEGLRIELPSPAVSDEALAEAQNAELSQSGSLEPVDRPAELGDYLTLDMSVTRDGEEVSGLNTDDWSYELGQGWVADTFDDEVVGASAGDKLTFTATPKGTDEEADFTVKVTMVQSLVLPELTDDWVSDNIGEFDTVEAWNESLRERLTDTALNRVRQQVGPKITQALTGLVEVTPPESMVTSELQSRVQNTVQQFQSQGIDLQAWLEATGQDTEGFIESLRGQAEEAVKADLALRAVAVAQNIDVSDEEIEMEYARMAMQYSQKAKDIRKAYESNDAVPELLAQIRKSKAFDWLLHHVEMVDAAGNVIDRDLVLGHTHDEDGGHDHEDHDHDHDNDDVADESAEGED